MLIKPIVVTIIILALNQAAGLMFYEDIVANGGGRLACRTDTEVGSDWIDASGNNQKYSRVVNVSMEDNIVSLTSQYSLNKHNASPIRAISSNDSTNKNNAHNSTSEYKYRSFKVKNSSSGKFDMDVQKLEDKSPNSYGIMMNDPGNLMHRIEVNDADNFSAKNSISFENGQVSTAYNLGGKGVLKGSVIESGPMGRPHEVARTEIEDTDFTIDSGVQSESQIGDESDVDKLSKAVEKPKIGSEEKQDESNKLEYYSLLENYLVNTATGEVIYKGEATGKRAEPKEMQYWFTWEDIPEDNYALFDLKRGLTENLSYIWAKNSNVDKINNNISVIGDGKSITLTLDGNRVKLSDGSQVLDRFSVEIKNKKHDIFIPKEYDRYNPAARNASASTNTSQPSQSRQINNTNLSGLIDPIIPGLIFGSPVNSTYVNEMTTVSEWGTIYIGRYKPMQDKNFGKVTQNYSVNLTEGIFTFENVSAKGPKQNYLNIRYEGSRIKIRNTPLGARFDVYKGPI